MISSLALICCQQAPVQSARTDSLCQVGSIIQDGAAQVGDALAAVEAGRAADAVAIASDIRADLGPTEALLRELLEDGVREEDVEQLELAVIGLEQLAIFLATAPDPRHPDLGNASRIVSDINATVADLPDLYDRYDARC